MTGGDPSAFVPKLLRNPLKRRSRRESKSREGCAHLTWSTIVQVRLNESWMPVRPREVSEVSDASRSDPVCRGRLYAGTLGELAGPVAIELARSRDLCVRRTGAERGTQGVRPRSLALEGDDEAG